MKKQIKKDKIELILISKSERSKTRRKMLKERDEIIKSTMEGNKNNKKMKKQLRLGIQWSSYFVDNEGANKITIGKKLTHT